jgi:hypothetical protein
MLRFERLIYYQVKQVLQQKKTRSKKVKVKFVPDEGFMLRTHD